MSSANVPVLIKTALARLKVGDEASRNQRQRELDDLKFQVPELQWDDAVRKERSGQMIDGVPVHARPMLSISKIDQPIQLITNQERAAHLGVLISPLDDEATDETAEMLQNLYRGIERESNAAIARSWAFDRAVKVGLGYYRILPEYADDGGDPLDQSIRIKRILNQASVILDPFAQEPDWCDGQWGFITQDLPIDRYQLAFPQSQLNNLDDSELMTLGTEQPGWVKGDEASRVVRVAEYFYVETAEMEWVKLAKGPRRGRVVRSDALKKGEDGDVARKGEDFKVHWCKINAIEALDQTTLPGRYIPIIPVIGKELQPFDAERRWTGIIGPAKGAQKLFNYEISGAVEASSLAPLSPWIGAEGTFEGHDTKWAQSNTRRFPYLEYKPVIKQGIMAPPPARTSAAADISTHLMLLEAADNAIQATTFTPDPSLGNLSARDRSGKAIKALQQQSEIGNSNYIQNQKDISVPYEAKIVLSWIPHYYDRPGRRVRAVLPDNTESSVIVNAPFYTDPRSKRARVVSPGMPPPEGAEVKEYDLKQGTYGVAVTVGKSWATGRQEGSEQLTNVLTAVPQLWPILGAIWAQHQDWPGHDEVAKNLKKMQPPQLQQGENGQPSPEQLQQQLQQAGQMVKQMQAKMAEMQQQLETDQAKQYAQVSIAQQKGQIDLAIEREKLAIERERLEMDRQKMQAELEIARIKAQAEIAKEQIKLQMAAGRMQFDAEIQNEQSAAVAAESERGRQHEADMAAMMAAREATPNGRGTT